MSARRSGRRTGERAGSGARYPRSARVNEVLREVVAETLERLADADDRLALVTVTAVRCDPDLRHALVLFASLGEPEREALEAVRIRLQAAVSQQVRLKRTPQLRFAADPAVRSGQAIEDILRTLQHSEAAPGPSAPRAPEGPGGGAEAAGGPAGGPEKPGNGER